MSKFASLKQLENAVPYILSAPADNGELKLIVTRPVTNERSTHQSVMLSASQGVEGDNWSKGCWLTLDDGRPHPDVQVCIMNWRVIEAIENEPDRRALAGDNLFIDMNLGTDNLKPGDRLALGDSTLEITAEPHNACKKFAARFGRDAARFVNEARGRQNRFRGIYAKVAKDGRVTLGDRLTRQD